MSVQSALDYLQKLRNGELAIITLADPHTGDTCVIYANGTTEGDNRGYGLLINQALAHITALQGMLQSAETLPNNETSGASQTTAPNETPIA